MFIGVCIGHLPPPGNGNLKQKFLENLRSAA